MGGLTFTERMHVKYAGARAVEAPLTLGQINTLDWLGDDTRAGLYRMMEWAVTVPDGTTLDDVAETLAALLERYEALRTSHTTAGRQQVSASGEVPLDVFETGLTPEHPIVPGEVIELIAAIQGRAAGDEADDPAVRAAVSVHDGAIRLVLLACSHMAVDCESLALVVRRFGELIRNPAERGARPPAHQPADQAAAENSPRGRRRAEASLRYWRRLLARMPQGVYAMPRPAGDADELQVRPDYAVPNLETAEGEPLGCWLDSPALRLALPRIAERTQTTLPMVLATAFCAVLAWRTGSPDLVFASLANNRIGTELHDYVGTLAQDSLLAVDAETDSFDDLARRVGAATLRAAMHGLYDVGRRWELQERIGHRRGVMFQRDCACNITIFNKAAPPSGSPDAAREALPRTTLRWHVPPYFRVLLLLRVIDSDGEPLLGLTTGHADLVPAAEIESLLLGIDRLLAEAAAGDVDLRRLGEITGITPVSRGPEWLCVDNCWIELPEVQRLVEDAAGVPARVFAGPDESDRTVLTAYLAAGEDAHTPAEVHRACVSRLLGRHTAMAPSRYVICAQAPADLDDLAAWRARPVLAAGDGREEA
jgi:hypothetical protein